MFLAASLKGNQRENMKNCPQLASWKVERQINRVFYYRSKNQLKQLVRVN